LSSKFYWTKLLVLGSFKITHEKVANNLQFIFRGGLGGLIDNKTPMICSGIPSSNQVFTTFWLLEDFLYFIYQTKYLYKTDLKVKTLNKIKLYYLWHIQCHLLQDGSWRQTGSFIKTREHFTGVPNSPFRVFCCLPVWRIDAAVFEHILNTFS